MSVLQLKTPSWAQPLLQPMRYKGARGGRGSGKSHFFAEMMLEDMIIDANLRCACIRETQKSLQHSSKLLLEQKINQYGLHDYFTVQYDCIKRKNGDGLIIFQGLRDSTADSIKSLEGFGRAWIEEAQSISERSLRILRPTIRADKSEIWASWNPVFEDDPIELLYNDITNGVVVDVNYDKNPFFNDVSNDERLLSKRLLSEQMYRHVWEGGYITGDMGEVFKWSWFNIHEYVAPFHGFENIIHSWDTAYKAGDHNDPSACTVWGLRDGKAHLLDCLNERMEYPQLKQAIIDMNNKHPATNILIEDKASGQSLIQELRELPIVAINPIGDKITRAVSSTTCMERGDVLMPHDAEWLATFKKQLIRFSHNKELLKKQHDDIVDSVSQFVNWWQTQGQSTEIDAMKRFYGL